MELLTSFEGLEAFEPEWWDVWGADPRATPFQSPAWLKPWVRHLWGGGRIFSPIFRESGRAAGFAPLFLWGNPGAVCVSFLGSGVSDYLDVLAVDGFGEQVASGVIDELGRERWDSCDLQELREDSPLLGYARRLPFSTADVCAVCPAVDLPDSLEAYVATLEPKFRTDLRRAENRLRNAGGLEFVKAADDSMAAALTEQLIRLHSARWRERSETGVLNTDGLRAFYLEVTAAMLCKGMLRLYGLYLNGECLAVQYNIAAKRRVYAYLSGFEPSWGKCSPGAVLLKHSIAEAIGEGALSFDFLRKQEPFKYQWGARDFANFRLQLRNSSQASTAV